MTGTITTAFWAMTINNYDDTDLALVRVGYGDYCREIIHTLEEGKEGTPHIQAYIKLHRQQRLSFLKKLFPRGHFKALTNAEYIENTKRYTQKDDETTRSAHVHVFHDPIHTIESLIKQVCLRIRTNMEMFEYSNSRLEEFRVRAEKSMVEQDYKLAKIFVSNSYKNMWREFGPAMYHNIVHTHTHTHTDEKFSHQEGTTKNGSSSRANGTADSASVSEVSSATSDWNGETQGLSDSESSWSSGGTDIC